MKEFIKPKLKISLNLWVDLFQSLNECMLFFLSVKTQKENRGCSAKEEQHTHSISSYYLLIKRHHKNL